MPASSVSRATLRMLLPLISWEGRGAHAGGMRPMKIPLELICSRGWKPLKVRLDLKVYSRRFIIEFLDWVRDLPPLLDFKVRKLKQNLTETVNKSKAISQPCSSVRGTE